MRTPDEVVVTVGESWVVVRRHNRSAAATARILGIDTAEDGAPCRIWLDRLVHRTGETTLGPWSVHGAVSTVLERVPERSD